MITVVNVNEFQLKNYSLSVGIDIVPEGCVKVKGITLEENIKLLVERNEKWCSDNLLFLIKELYQNGIKALQMFNNENIALVYKNSLVGLAFSQLI